MITRLALLLALMTSACGGARPEALVTSESFDFGTLRRYGPGSTVLVTVQNLGSEPLEVASIDVPDGVTASPSAFTVEGAPGAVTVELTLDTAEAREVDGGLVLHTNDALTPDHEGPLTGEVTPYIRTALEEHPELDAYLEGEMASEQLVGVGAAVIRNQDIVYLRGFGFEDQEAARQVDPNATLFRWASVAKGVTALASMIAVEAGDLDLDEPVETYLSEYTPPSTYLAGCSDESCLTTLAPTDRRVTMRRLLSHTAGMQHYSNGLVDPVPPASITDDPAQNQGFAWALTYWTDAPLISVPGTRYAYSTFGFNLAGAVLESAVASPFADYVHEHISEVLEMSSMRPDYAWVADRRRAVGYWRNSSGSIGRDADTDVSWKLPAGGYVSTVADLARYCGGLMGDVVVPAARRDEMWTVQAPAATYGLGFGVTEGQVSHTGAQQKTRTALLVRRDEGLCFVFMTNATWADPGELIGGMSEAWR